MGMCLQRSHQEHGGVAGAVIIPAIQNKPTSSIQMTDYGDALLQEPATLVFAWHAGKKTIPHKVIRQEVPHHVKLAERKIKSINKFQNKEIFGFLLVCDTNFF